MTKLLALAAVLAAEANAQCVMCFRTAAAQQQARAQVLNHGIMIMLLPPVLILGFFVLLAYRRRSTYSVLSANPPADAASEVDFLYEEPIDRVR